MSHRLIEELRRENLCTHFILPLLKLNKFSFLSGNFINAYISTSKRELIVQVADRALVSRKAFTHPYYHSDIWNGSSLYIIYELPSKWANDLDLFCSGQFSKMSKAAKGYIRRYSGLPWEANNGSDIVTDGRLLALDKHEVLKEMWERELSTKYSVVELDAEAELLSKPGEESYISLEVHSWK